MRQAIRAVVADGKVTEAEWNGVLRPQADVRADWQGKVASGGTINVERATRLAALTGLVRGGKTPEAAADQLGLRGTERTRLVELVNSYVREG